MEFPTVQEAYDYVLSLKPPMSFRTDAPNPVCIPIDPESSPEQLTERTYAILRKQLLFDGRERSSNQSMSICMYVCVCKN
jgi:hypothetical protein